jgi:D-3-phosphoglycerate dehydrogenase
MKILANDGISQTGIDKLEAHGFTVVTEKVPQDQIEAAINAENYIGLLVRSATTARKELIDNCPNLKFIGRGGVGMDNIDVDYAKSKGLAVFNTPGASSQSVAELVMGHLFGLSRGLFDSNRQMPPNGHLDFKTLKKKYGQGTELRGKKLGIVGFGRIGRSLASYALGCGMEVVACDVYRSDETVPVQVGNQVINVQVPFLEMNDLLAESDCISLHVPAQGGKSVIGDAEFDLMKGGVLLVNAARGGVIDESALLRALDNGKVSFAALDVFSNEPNPSEKVLSHSRISLSPHIGAATVEAQDRIGIELADQIIEFIGVKA